MSRVRRARGHQPWYPTGFGSRLRAELSGVLHPKSGWAAVEPLGSGFPRQANCGELGTSDGIASASVRLPIRSASSADAAATPRSQRAGGDESHPFEARTIARIPARIAPQAAANSASSRAAGAVGSTPGSTFSGLRFSSGKSMPGNRLSFLVLQLDLHYRI